MFWKDYDRYRPVDKYSWSAPPHELSPWVVATSAYFEDHELLSAFLQDNGVPTVVKKLPPFCPWWVEKKEWKKLRRKIVRNQKAKRKPQSLLDRLPFKWFGGTSSGKKKASLTTCS